VNISTVSNWDWRNEQQITTILLRSKRCGDFDYCKLTVIITR